jgi:hypothetical protein
MLFLLFNELFYRAGLEPLFENLIGKPGTVGNGVSLSGIWSKD